MHENLWRCVLGHLESPKGTPATVDAQRFSRCFLIDALRTAGDALWSMPPLPKKSAEFAVER